MELKLGKGRSKARKWRKWRNGIFWGEGGGDERK